VKDASAPSRYGSLEFGDPGVDEGGVVAAQVQRTGDGFLVRHKQSTADLMCVKTVRAADTIIGVRGLRGGGWSSLNQGLLVWHTPSGRSLHHDA
jgi:hypothetical protein